MRRPSKPSMGHVWSPWDDAASMYHAAVIQATVTMSMVWSLAHTSVGPFNGGLWLPLYVPCTHMPPASHSCSSKPPGC